MSKIKTAILITLAVVLLIMGLFFGVGLLRPKAAGIYIEAEPAANVYVNGVQVGHTSPTSVNGSTLNVYKDTMKPGDTVVRLIPDTFEKPLFPYETRVTLVPGVETVIRREFGQSDDDSAGETVSFEKVSRSETSLAIISVPDAAQILIDGTNKAFAPYKTSSITPGEHTVVVSADGYKDRSMRVRTIMGYKLTAVVKLAVSNEEPTVTPAPDVTPEETAAPEAPQVEILSTGTGFLRVRSEPSTLGTEVGQVEPGERYTLLETDEKSGWYKIEFDDKEGWVSNQYAKKVEQTSEGTPTPTGKATSTSKVTPTPKVSL